jgi:hypothetical protein
MSTLEYWEGKLIRVPSTIECPEMQLMSADDNEPPIFVGPGHIDIRSSTAIDFTMFATPADSADAPRRIKQARENPYEISEQFRLFATDYQGTEWECGWTRPTLKGIPRIGWPLKGSLNSLLTGASGPWASGESGVELVFHPRFWLPTDKTMITVTSIDGVEVQRDYTFGQQVVHALGSEIRFFYTPSGESLWATAKTSDKLPHPYAENWLSEPLRILLGQPIYPRLVARNFGDGNCTCLASFITSAPQGFQTCLAYRGKSAQQRCRVLEFVLQPAHTNCRSQGQRWLSGLRGAPTHTILRRNHSGYPRIEVDPLHDPRQLSRRSGADARPRQANQGGQLHEDARATRRPG